MLRRADVESSIKSEVRLGVLLSTCSRHQQSHKSGGGSMKTLGLHSKGDNNRILKQRGCSLPNRQNTSYTTHDKQNEGDEQAVVITLSPRRRHQVRRRLLGSSPTSGPSCTMHASSNGDEVRIVLAKNFKMLQQKYATSWNPVCPKL